MTDPGDKSGARQSLWSALALVAVLMTLYALAINNITFASDDYTSIVMQAVAVAGLAQIVVVAIWRRVPRAVRAMLALCVLANLWTLVDAGGRRLPAVMGW